MPNHRHRLNFLRRPTPRGTRLGPPPPSLCAAICKIRTGCFAKQQRLQRFARVDSSSRSSQRARVGGEGAGPALPLRPQILSARNNRTVDQNALCVAHGDTVLTRVARNPQVGARRRAQSAAGRASGLARGEAGLGPSVRQNGVFRCGHDGPREQDGVWAAEFGVDGEPAAPRAPPQARARDHRPEQGPVLHAKPSGWVPAAS